MAAAIDILAYNNERGVLSRSVSVWAAVYDLSTVTWRLQVRTTAASKVIVLDVPNSVGEVHYADEVVVFLTPLAAMSKLSGTYEWDFTLQPPGLDPIRCGGGAFVVEDGVTR